MAIVDVETVKTLLQITTNDYDSSIEAYIPQVEADFERIRGLEFSEDSQGITDYPDNSELIASQMVGWLLKTSAFSSTTFNNIQSESIGSYSYTKETSSPQNMLEGYPKSITGRIERYHNPKT